MVHMVQLESTGEMTRTEVASFLREFADELDAEVPTRTDDDRVPTDGGVATGESATEQPLPDEDGSMRGDLDGDLGDPPRQITFVGGGDSATVTVPETVNLEVTVDSRSPLFRSGDTQELTFELSWRVDATHADEPIDLV